MWTGRALKVSCSVFVRRALAVRSDRPLLLFKALPLRAWYGLSDAELEFRLGQPAFGRFVGLSLEDERPDHTTFCRFRNRLVSAQILDHTLTP